MGVAGFRLYGELERIMSWRPEERKRSAAFCVAYFAAWFFHQTLALIFGFLIILVLFPNSRHFFFPPMRPPPFVQPSVTDPTNRSGDQSILTSGSPAVSRTKAEQAEQQAKEFMKISERFGMRIIMGGRHKTEVPDEDGNYIADKASSTSETKTEDGVLVKSPSSDDDEEPEAPGVKEKRDAIVGQAAKMLQDILSDLADNAEMTAKYGIGLTNAELRTNSSYQCPLPTSTVPEILRSGKDSCGPPRVGDCQFACAS
jgi:hypothetical protein